MTIYSLYTPDPNVTVLKYWKDVPFVAAHEHIEFGPGLNIVFGPNGSGKTTLIKTLALVLHVFQGGFQRVTIDSLRAVFDSVLHSSDISSMQQAVNSIQRAVTDGEDVKFASGDQDIGFYDGHIDDDFFADYIALHKSPLSSGQKALAKINRLLTIPSEAKRNIFAVNKEYVNSLWQERIKIVESHFQPQSKKDVKRQQTILLDEPDRSMDFDCQAALWNLLRKAAPKYQVIVASHSPLALGLPEATYIESVPNAVEKLTAVLSDAGWTRTSVPSLK